MLTAPFLTLLNWFYMTWQRVVGGRPTLCRALMPFHYQFRRLMNLMSHWQGDNILAVSLEISTACNRRCSYCPQSVSPMPKAHMREDVFRRCVEHLEAMQFKGELNLSSYSEPLLDERLVRFVGTLAERVPGAWIRIYTNGDFLTHDIAKQLQDAGAWDILVTLHEPNPSLHCQSLAEEFNGFIHISRIGTHYMMDRAKAVSVPGAMPQVNCSYMLKHIVVGYDGTVLLCCNDYHREHTWGNVMNETLQQIWDRPSFREFRKNIWRGEYNLAMCRRCMGLK